MQTNNTTALVELKSMDMKYHCLQCRISQDQFRHYWKAGKTNLANYITKLHPALHHQTTRGTFLTDISKLVEFSNRQKCKAMTAVTKTACSKGVLDLLGLPNTASDYKKALEAIKLLTESVRRGPLKSGHQALFV
jgi:hypothetical protein